MIGKCLNPDECYNKHLSWVKRKKMFIARHERVFEHFKEDGRYDYSNHTLKRMRERMISDDDIAIVLQEGWVVEGYKDGTLIVLGYYKFGGRFMPLHIVLVPKATYWLVSTIYNPHKKIWSENLETKVCFCGKARFGEEM